MLDVMIPSERSRHSMRLAGEASAASRSVPRRSSTFWRITRPQTGIGTWRGGFLTKPTARGAARPAVSTRLREWLTRVVVRRMTGVEKRSETSSANPTKSLASCESDGSKIGILANRA